MSERPGLVFLDDDHVLRILRLILCNAENEPRVQDFFVPENPDFSSLIALAEGLRRSDGADVALASESAAHADASVLIFRRGAITKELLASYPRLKLIQRLGERADDIDVAAAEARGVYVSCFPRLTVQLTAEHAVLLMLALAKRLVPADRMLRDGQRPRTTRSPMDGVLYNWVGVDAPSGLYGKTLGIIGLGEIGSVVARIARGFGMQVLYFNRHRIAPEREIASGARYSALGDLLARSDFVSLHANLPGNAKIADRRFFDGMKRSAFFINTSRGQLVDEDALYEALTLRKIAGAGLDVHAPEPRPAGERFTALSNVVLTPHIAGGSRSGVLQEFEVIVRNSSAAMRGEPPSHRVRPGRSATA